MSMNKKILAAAIVSGLFVTTANAAVTISATNPVPVSIASELNFTAGNLTVTGSAATDLTSAIKYSFSNTEVRYARFECTGMKFAVGTTAATTAAATLGAVNGIGTNAISFSVTATAATSAAATFTVSGDRTFTANTPVTCTYGLYDQPSQAASGGTTGLIATASGAYAKFESSYLYDLTPNTTTASVEADPSFTEFTTASAAGITKAQLAQVDFDTRNNLTGDPQPLKANGTASTLADILAAGSKHVVTGDFSSAANANGTFTGAAALNRVFISGTANCAAVATAATAVTATTATFVTGAAPISGYLCYQPRAGLTIPASTYTLTFVPASNAGYTAGGLGPDAAGEIDRDGTELQAPLVQLPGNGWLSRMVLTNTGSIARPYTVGVLRETGNAGTTANLTGTVPANGTIVVDLNTILPTFSAGAPRATLNVTIAGPNKQIQGLYQIVNANSLTISNHVMVRPGTN